MTEARPASLDKQEMAYSAIRRKIVDGEYLPGQHLIAGEIADELGVSPMPVREAIRRLAAEKWIVYNRHRSGQVMTFDPEQWSDSMEMLGVLEGYATSLAVPFLTPEDISVLRKNTHQMRSDLDGLDYHEAAQGFMSFHKVLYAKCPNKALLETLSSLQDRLDAMHRSTYAPLETNNVTADEHDALLDLIEKGSSVAEIEHFARDHRLRAIQAFRERVRRR